VTDDPKTLHAPAVETKEAPECPRCKRRDESVQLHWSDREGEYHKSQFYEAVLHCSLDHSYDRTGTGVPYGMPEAYAEAFAPIVEKHLSAVEPNWQEKTVYMTAEQSAAFSAELLAAQERVASENGEPRL
jgi:hypothetical protein